MLHRHSPLLLNTWPGVLFWLHGLLLELHTLTQVTCSYVLLLQVIVTKTQWSLQRTTLLSWGKNWDEWKTSSCRKFSLSHQCYTTEHNHQTTTSPSQSYNPNSGFFIISIWAWHSGHVGSAIWGGFGLVPVMAQTEKNLELGTGHFVGRYLDH